VQAFSKILKFHTVIACSPQYSIDEDFDRRWEAFGKNIDFKYRINKENINENCNYFIIYDNKCADDFHVKKLLDILPIQKINLIKLPYTGHPSINYLVEVGLHKDVLIKLSNEDSFDGINFFAKKNFSISYLGNLSDALIKKNHFKIALSIINSALKIDENIASTHQRKSGILDKMGLTHEAIECIKRSITLQPSSANNYYILSGLFLKLGLLNEAVDAAVKSVSLNNSNPYLFGYLSQILLHGNSLNDALFTIDSAIKIDQTIAWLHAHKSKILEKMNQTEDAIICIKKAIALESENKNYQNSLKNLNND
jgi:tetratricopeptide (TPR) repeat protein